MISLSLFASGFGDRTRDLLGHPYALARTALRQELYRLKLDSTTGQVLDVGCGSMPYRSLFKKVTSYHGLEIDQPRNRSNPHVTFWYDGTQFPLAHKSYAAVFCSQVLEHTFTPERLIAEVFRVLEPGGHFILTIPFFWPEHEQPYDSQRLTSFGLVQRLHQAGFVDVRVKKTNPGITALLQLSIEWLESLQRRYLRGRASSVWRLLTFVPYSIMNLIGACYRSCPWVRRSLADAELYLDLVVSARKP